MKAIRRQPEIVTRNGKPVSVILSIKDYEELLERAEDAEDGRAASNNVPRNLVPAILLERSEWLLPFALTYPHRVTRELSGVIDALIGERADLV